MSGDFTRIDYINNDIIEYKDQEGKLVIKQFSGVNSDNFTIKKCLEFGSQKKITFSFCKLNGIYYVNINGEHMIDYKKFICIQQISNNDVNGSVSIVNKYTGTIVLENCDTEIVQKSLEIMAKYIKNKTSHYSDLLYFLRSF